MAATDSQKQLLTLIRDFAAEKSRGERRIINLKKRIDELLSELETANLELENRKSLKETAEQELKGYEVQLSITESSIQTLEARTASIQDEISKLRSDVEALKIDEAALRDLFIDQMLELKTKIRKFQEFALLDFQRRSFQITSPEDSRARSEITKFHDLEKEISVAVSQIETEERECEREKNLHNQLHQALDDSKRRKELIEAVKKDIKELQDLTRQTSELETKCASFSEELQRMCICPSCQVDNSESLAELLQQMGHQ